VSAKRYREPRILSGMKRRYVRCRECRAAYYYDFVPFGLSSPIMATRCGHSIGHDDLNADTITRSAFLRAHRTPSRRLAGRRSTRGAS
jgi:hypothetical protein